MSKTNLKDAMTIQNEYGLTITEDFVQVAINEKKLIYLASPYNHSSVEVRYSRYTEVLLATTELIHKGLHVYSPIVHNHKICQLRDLDRDFEFWREFDFNMLKRCDALVVLMMDGWKQSVGVNAEINFAVEKYIHVHFMSRAYISDISNSERAT